MASADFLTAILEVIARTARARDPLESLHAASGAFRHLAGFDGAGLLLPDNDSSPGSRVGGWELWIAGSAGPPEPIPSEAAIARPVASGDPLVAARDEVECEASRAVLLARGHACVLSLPLRVEDRAVGGLLLFGDDADAFAGVDLAPLLAGASIVAVAIEHARDRAALERQAGEQGLRRDRPGDRWSPRPRAPRPTPGGARRTPDLRTLAEIERDAIARVLAHTGGRVSGARGAAAILGMKPTTLQSRMKKLGVRRRP